VATIAASDVPDHELLVGGFPCQDYSVAKTLNQAHGLAGKKGVLWWEIHRILEAKRPPFVFLENVDRLLKSPATQRGRDFAIMLASLSDLGYEVEWRMVNAADYGFPQKRRRVYIVARLADSGLDPSDVFSAGTLAHALPVHSVEVPDLGLLDHFDLVGDLAELTEGFRAPANVSPFRNAGFMCHRRVWSRDARPRHDDGRSTLAGVLEDSADVPDRFFVPDEQLDTWRYLKGAKNEERVHKASGTAYRYVEGPIPFPDDIDGPSRTILTAEGGATPSRFKHLIRMPDGRYRRLTPRELERLDGFPVDWTEGMSDGRRAFCMGNALVVGVIERIGAELAKELDAIEEPLALAVS
jgi:DNA (cytosine-5)-methyltransferase 1